MKGGADRSVDARLQKPDPRRQVFFCHQEPQTAPTPTFSEPGRGPAQGSLRAGKIHVAGTSPGSHLQASRCE